ncbi:hypothetical protein NDU88_010177 [Pleurodeles waltl]|uniref:Uncharacterized protein n=1 Tax=Pleurodeles waltl TaxID=8319 RepID=A0AAV7PXY2_PLEWA|nr:hypothetical protein NDU88_010177 [Pleurodeles waltl]
MGKHDAIQPKLNFDHKRSTRQGELEQGPRAAEGRDLAADDQGEDLRTLMLEMRSSLRNIDTKLDNLASQLDSVKTQVATHETSNGALHVLDRHILLQATQKKTIQINRNKENNKVSKVEEEPVKDNTALGRYIVINRPEDKARNLEYGEG